MGYSREQAMEASRQGSLTQALTYLRDQDDFSDGNEEDDGEEIDLLAMINEILLNPAHEDDREKIRQDPEYLNVVIERVKDSHPEAYQFMKQNPEVVKQLTMAMLDATEEDGDPDIIEMDPQQLTELSRLNLNIVHALTRGSGVPRNPQEEGEESPDQGDEGNAPFPEDEVLTPQDEDNVKYVVNQLNLANESRGFY